jgi:epoxyqueuosine reductase
MVRKHQGRIDPGQLKSFAESIGIGGIGWFKSCNFPEYLKTIKERSEYHYFRYRPYQIFLDAGHLKDLKGNIKTVIVIFADYFYENDYSQNGFKISNYSRFCLQTVTPKADRVIQFLRDNGYHAEKLDLPDKVAACQAGLGFFGKNCLFYAYRFRSYVGINTIGTDLRLERTSKGKECVTSSVCKKCNKCIKACPTNAIYPEGYRINPFKCLSFINRHPEEPYKEVPEDTSKFNNWLHGCEICQDVCPLNKNIKHGKKAIILPEIDLYGMKVPNVSSISKEILIKGLKDINSPGYREYISKSLGNIN